MLYTQSETNRVGGSANAPARLLSEQKSIIWLGALAALATLAGSALSNPETATGSAEAAFKTATGLMEKQQFKRAIPYLQRVQKELPENDAVLWNLGLAYAEINEHGNAAETWRTYQKVRPDDWRARAKLVQAYQALGDSKARDDEIRSLYDYRENSPDPQLKTADRFCREQFAIGARRVFAFENFSPQGERKKFLRFSILDKKGDEQFYISLGSYDFTTDVVRELGEIPKDSRIYHLDLYKGRVHETYAFFEERPGYDRVRPMVISILQGKSKPISASSH